MLLLDYWNTEMHCDYVGQSMYQTSQCHDWNDIISLANKSWMGFHFEILFSDFCTFAIYKPKSYALTDLCIRNRNPIPSLLFHRNFYWIFASESILGVCWLLFTFSTVKYNQFTLVPLSFVTYLFYIL